MNPLSNGAEESTVPPAPLFSSSLMALFRIIRHGIGGQHRDANTPPTPECDEARPLEY